MKNKNFWILAAVAIVLLAIGLFPNLNAPTRTMHRMVRAGKLRGWYYQAQEFIRDNKRLPNSIFEMSKKDLESGNWPGAPTIVSQGLHPKVPVTCDPNELIPAAPGTF